MDYKEWLIYQELNEPYCYVLFDPALGANVRLVDSPISGITIIKVEGHGFIIMDSVAARRRYSRLYPPSHRCYEGARPISFMEPGYVFAPYIPDLTRK